MKDCPFCGSKNVSLAEFLSNAEFSVHRYSVICKSCGAESGSAKTAVDAVDKWEKRPPESSGIKMELPIGSKFTYEGNLYEAKEGKDCFDIASGIDSCDLGRSTDAKCCKHFICEAKDRKSGIGVIYVRSV